MNDALKALHNEMNRYMADQGIAAHQPIQFLDLRLLLSALAQSGPQEVAPLAGHHKSAPSQEGAGPAGGAAPQEAGGDITNQQACGYEQPNGWHCLPPKEYKRLRARDKWIEDYAKPALQAGDHDACKLVNLYARALAALPASTEGK